MSYSKQTWANGDVITAEKLNHMEDGISSGGGGIFVVNLDTTTNTLDQTWQAIHDALVANKIVLLAYEYDDGEEGHTIERTMIVGASTENGYAVNTINDWYLADSADGYPVAN